MSDFNWGSASIFKSRYKEFAKRGFDSDEGEQQFPPESLRRGKTVTPEEVELSRRILADQLDMSLEELDASPMGMGH